MQDNINVSKPLSIGTYVYYLYVNIYLFDGFAVKPQLFLVKNLL